MEPNKLDKIIKEKFEQRTIQPSDKAWDRLDAMLSVSENKKPTKKWNWLSIAAVFLGFVLLGTLVFTFTNQNEVVKNPIVFENQVDKESTQPKTENNKIDDVIQDNTIINEGIVILEKNLKLEKKSNKLSIQNNLIVKNQENKISKDLKEQNHNEKLDVDKEIIFLNTENLAIVNLSKVVKTNDSKIIIDSKELLSQVDKNPRNVTKISKIKINPNDLISEIDVEINTSFRQKALAKIKDNYQSAKVSLLARNQE